jgi:hypothetical protein
MDAKLNSALVIIHDLLSPISDNWVIIGTSSLYLIGYPVKPNDVDILAPADEADLISAALKEYSFKHSILPNNKFKSLFNKYLINGVTVEVMCGLEVNTKHGWMLLQNQIKQPQIVEVNGQKFRVPGKADQISIYNLFNRAKDRAVLAILKNEH